MKLFPSLNAREDLMSSAQLQAMAGMYQQDLLTGIIEVNFESDVQIALLFADGNLINAYYTTPEIVERLEKIEWGRRASMLGQGAVRVLKLPYQAMRLCKVLIEAHAGELQNLTKNELGKTLSEFEKTPSLRLINLNWKSADALIIMSAAQGFSKHSMLINEERAQFDTLHAIVNWREEECQLRICRINPSSQAWLEYQLFQIFSEVSGQILTRFESLAGRTLINTLSTEINNATRLRRWNITCIGSGILDQQVFESTEDAAQTYRFLLRIVYQYVSGIVGSKEVDDILLAAAEKFDENMRAVLEKHPILPIAQLVKS